jgi:hypothetical protein
MLFIGFFVFSLQFDNHRFSFLLILIDSLSILCIYALYILLLALNCISICPTLVNNLAR